MSRRDLVKAVRAAVYPKPSSADAARAVNAIFDSIAAALRTGADVKLTGFGTFFTRDQAPYRGRNPRTGAAVDVPARRIAKFRASKSLLS